MNKVIQNLKKLIPQTYRPIIKRAIHPIMRAKIYRFYEIIQSRETASVCDLEALCKDIPISNFISHESISINDFYGNATTLKLFSGIQDNFRMRHSIQHGVYFYGDERFWGIENKCANRYLCWGRETAKIYHDGTGLDATSIGAPFFYADSIMTSTDIEKEKRRLGKNILVFPIHSTHYSDILFDKNSFIENILITKKKYGFDSVRICLYWKDYNINDVSLYESQGFECVTAGHIFDINFLRRLKSLILVSDSTYSNSIGSFIGYSLWEGRPFIRGHQNAVRVCVEEDSAEARADREYCQSLFEKENSILNSESMDIHKIFYDDNVITDEQIKFCDMYWGFSCVKSKKELRSIITS